MQHWTRVLLKNLNVDKKQLLRHLFLNKNENSFQLFTYKQKQAVYMVTDAYNTVFVEMVKNVGNITPC